MIDISPIKNYAIARATNGNEFSYKLSPSQQSMLFNSISTQQAGLDIKQAICSLHENLNVSALMRAWQRVVERYEILRSYFSWEGLNEPVQTLHGFVELPFEHQNWCALSSSEQQDRLNAYIRDDRQRGFDITKAPLMRLALLQLSDTEYKLICTFHNILLDNRSFAILCKQVFTFYEAFCQGQDLELPISRPYRHYIEWLQQQDLSKAETFWKQTLRGFDAPTPLVVELAPNQGQSQQAGHGEQEIQLSEVVTSKLLVLAQDHALTIHTLIQGAWALILSRYSGEEDVVFGGVRECRPSALEGADSMLGLFINILPVRVSVSADMSVLTWLKHLQAAWISLEDYEQTPLAKVLEWSEIPRGTSLFESILVVENYEINSVLQGHNSNCTTPEFQLIKQTTFPLTIYANFRKNLLLKIEYDRQRFEEAIINRMLGHLATSIESMVTNPHQEIAQLPMLTNWEQQQLWQWNETQANYGQDKCVHQLFEAQVEKTPDAIAAVMPAIAQQNSKATNQPTAQKNPIPNPKSQIPNQLTYQELNARANQLAHHLKQLGIKPDVFAAICMERSMHMAIAVLAILKAGGAYVPLDPAYPKERLAFMLADTQAPVILTQTHLVQSLPEHQARVICLDADWQSISQNSTNNPESSVTPDNLTYAIYTSGSTGKPKGVALEHRALSNLISWQLQNSKLTGEARTLQFASLSFDVSFQEMFSTWWAGGTLVFISEEIRRDAPSLLQFINNEKIERLFLPFIALQHIAEAADTYAIAPQSISEVVTAGEQLQINRYIAGFFKQLKNCTLHNHYGPSESHVVTAFTLTGSPDDWPALPPIGRPIANNQIYLLDRHLQPVPVGVPGELYIGGIGLARGYLNRPELTEEKFIANPFIDFGLSILDFGLEEESNNPKSKIQNPSSDNFVRDRAQNLEKEKSRLYKSGDLARYLPDGNIEYIGRIDNQVKVRGFRIELGEIETALAKHPAVKQAVVLVREDEPGDKRLVAYLVADEGQELVTTDLRRYLQGQLPDYMIPAIFIAVEALPKTPSGKIDRRALPAPDSQRPILEQNYVAPQSEVERSLAAVWSEILKVDRVGINDNFFELGGNSLLTLQVAGQVREKLKINLPIVKLFQHPTIGELANYLNQGSSDRHEVDKHGDRAQRQKEAMLRRKQSPRGR